MTESMWGAEEMVTARGLPLRVVRRGSGSPLLLLNGIGAPAEMWAPLAGRLVEQELIAVDLPGSGSSPPARWPLRIRGLAGLVRDLLDVLELDTVDVLGYSFGGIVAQELAWRAAPRVRRLVLCATSPGFGSLPPQPLAAMLMLTPLRYHSPAAARWIVPLIAGGRTRHNRGALDRNLALRLANPPALQGYVHQLYAVTGWTSLPWLRRMGHPTLILHGDQDPLVPLRNARRMAALIPRARLGVVRGGGHLFLVDQPESVVPQLIRFLGSPELHPEPNGYG
jgi:poly(3-hydroxyoctanoate) depolymerase